MLIEVLFFTFYLDKRDFWNTVSIIFKSLISHFYVEYTNASDA